nr:hypothetical protein [Tanacetum cinerariifolium]
MTNPNLIMSNLPIVSPFLKDSIVHIPCTNAKKFTDDVLSNHAGDKEVKSMDGVGNRVLIKKENEKDDMCNDEEDAWR